MSNQLKSKSEASGDAKWASVRDAITERWPHINRDELAECKDDADELVEFVKERVGDSAEEVQSVVSEFAPHASMSDRVSQATHAASDQAHKAGEAAQFAYMRADECIAERPTESVLVSFVAGVAVGAVVTALLMRSAPQPSTWDRVKSHSYF